MAQNIYITSFLWLVSLGGIGYGLLKLTTPSEEKIKRIKESSPNNSTSDEQKALFLKRLKEATTERPIYQAPSIKKE